MLFLDAESRSVSFWLALEEYVQTWVCAADRSSSGSSASSPLSAARDGIAFVWQDSEPTIVFGKNQVPEAEFDIARARREGVTLVRRPSGGGAIYSDKGNLFYSLLLPTAPGANPTETMRKGAEPLMRALRRLGISAELRGRNDLELDGAKIAGFAQYLRENVLCAHSTLLYNADLSVLGQLLKPDREKYESKALKSVRSRVTNIAEHLECAPPIGVFRSQLQEALMLELPNVVKYELSAEDSARVEKLQKSRFENPDWLWGKTPPYTYRNKQRFTGGSVEVLLDIKDGAIAGCTLRGDFFGLQDVAELEDRLTGLRYDKNALEAALANIDLSQYLGTITTKEMLNVLF